MISNSFATIGRNRRVKQVNLQKNILLTKDESFRASPSETDFGISLAPPFLAYSQNGGGNSGKGVNSGGQINVYNTFFQPVIVSPSGEGGIDSGKSKNILQNNFRNVI